MTPAADDDEWTYSIEDVSDGEGTGDEGRYGDGTNDEGTDADGADEGGSVFGPRPDEGDGEILPGDPDLEHVLFVALGVATTLVLMLDLVGVV